MEQVSQPVASRRTRRSARPCAKHLLTKHPFHMKITDEVEYGGTIARSAIASSPTLCTDQTGGVMKARAVRYVLASASCLLAITGISIVSAQGDDGSVAKQAAIARGANSPLITGADLAQLLHPAGAVQWSTAKDLFTGDRADVAQMKRVAPLLVEQLNKSRALPFDRGARLSLLGGAAHQDRAAHAAAVWDRSVLPERLATLDDNASVERANPDLPTFDDAQVSLTAWNSLSIAGDRGEAIFTGTSSRHEATGWIDEGVSQWQVSLQRDPVDGVWRLLQVHVLAEEDFK